MVTLEGIEHSASKLAYPVLTTATQPCESAVVPLW